MTRVQISPNVISRLTGTGLVLVEVVLVAIIALLGARLFWVVVAPQHPAHSFTVQRQSVPATNSQSLLADRSILGRFDPFFRNIEFVSDAAVEDAPETTLNLAIESLLSSTNSELRSVRIRMPSDNRVVAFREGDTVINGVTIDRILSDRVILTNQGEQQLLLLRDAPLSALTEVEMIDGVYSPSARSEENASEDAAFVSTSPSSVTGADERYTIESVVDFYQIVEIEPDYRNGEIENYRVIGRDNAALSQVGLEVGDRLTEVNGQAVKDMEENALLALIGGQTKIQVTLMRGSETRTVEIVVGDE